MTFKGPMSDISDNTHSLLEPPSPAYTNVTVRRAFIVWMYCGQRNKFKDVCNYFHHLESLENQLPPERRALSRHHEFNLFSNQPPTSNYLIDNFPHLYKETYVEKHYISKVEEIRNEKCVFKLEGFNDIAPRQGTTTQEIVEASCMIRKYCRIQMVSLKKFLEEFKQHARKCDLKFTVNNVVFYIKRKMVQAEVELEANYPKTLDFLNTSISVENLFNNIKDTSVQDHCEGTCKSELAYNKNLVDDCFKPLKILRKGAEDSNEVAKNNCNNTNKTNNYNMNLDVDKGTIDDRIVGISDLKRNEALITVNMKCISIENLGDEDIPVKKERRFSGSRFMKIELDKIRKI